YQQLVNSQEERAKLIQKSALPTIDIIGAGWARGSGIDRTTKGYSSNPMDGIPYQTYNYMGAVAVRWNIFSLGKAKDEYRAAEQEVENYRYRLKEQTMSLQKQIQEANLRYQYALEQTAMAPVQYKAALEAFNSSNARYQAG